jgi:hypothetical protein
MIASAGPNKADRGFGPVTNGAERARWKDSICSNYCFTANALRAPVRTFVMGGSDHRNHPALARKLQACLRWRNAHARHPGVLAAQRRERARLRSERQQRWGRPKPKAA